MKPAVAAMLVALALPGCARSSACAPESDLAAIEASYQAELVKACAHFMPADPPSRCPEYEAITERARRAREGWASCQR
jgi:hypothetical protein